LDDGTNEIPVSVKRMTQPYLDQIDLLTAKTEDLTLGLRDATKENVEMRRLCAVPGVGPVTAGTVMAFAPDLQFSEPMWTLFFELHTGSVAQAAIRGLTHDR